MSAEAAGRSIFAEIYVWGRLVKFSHSVFALPFALSMLVIVDRRQAVTFGQLLAILSAVVAARTSAMAFNRLADHRLDTLNPRTAGREIPSGVLAKQSVILFFLLTSTIFLISAAWLGMHCLVLAPVVLAVLCFYSYTKRITWHSHLILGVALALAPGGVWYALTARVAWLPLILMLAVALWVAGFDILYSCQDIDFDRQQKLHSIPARWGAKKAFMIARFLHSCAVVTLCGFGALAELGIIYFIGVFIFALLLFSQHRLISAKDLTAINAAFFVRNGQASIVFLLAVVLDAL